MLWVINVADAVGLAIVAVLLVGTGVAYGIACLVDWIRWRRRR